MCRFIKEDGERCGIDAEPFCHMHDETPQSHFYHSMEELKDDLSEVMSMVDADSRNGSNRGSSEGSDRDERRSADADEASSSIVMDRTCGSCNSALRRTERLTEHPNMGGRLVFEAVVECDCDQHVLGAKSVRTKDLPAGWIDVE